MRMVRPATKRIMNDPTRKKEGSRERPTLGKVNFPTVFLSLCMHRSKWKKTTLPNSVRRAKGADCEPQLPPNQDLVASSKLSGLHHGEHEATSQAFATSGSRKKRGVTHLSGGWWGSSVM